MNRTNGSASEVNESAAESTLPVAPSSKTIPGTTTGIRNGRPRKGGKGKFSVVSTLSLTFLVAVTLSSLIPIYFYHSTDHHEVVDALSTNSGMIASLMEWKQAVNNTKSANKLPWKPDQNQNTDSLHLNALLRDATVKTDDGNPLLRVLQTAGVSVDDADVDRLPRVYQDMTSQYGDMQRPVIFGMDTCRAYQQTVPKERRIAAVAGMFNTGTNAMEYHLRENLSIKSLWQVPWGKHRVPYVRLQHVAPGMTQIQQEDVLPIIMIRDPFHWMQSMCKSPYAAHWKKTRLHCPNLVPTEHDLQRFGPELAATNHTFNVTVHFDTNQVIHWKSLIDLYNDWYLQYFINATYPRLIVRFEDMLLHAPTILQVIGRCVGVDASSTFKFQVNSAKQHGSHTDFMSALLKSGNRDARVRNMTSEDIQFAVQNLDPYLMETMQYQMP
jgi:hypothetical protein